MSGYECNLIAVNYFIIYILLFQRDIPKSEPYEQSIPRSHYEYNNENTTEHETLITVAESYSPSASQQQTSNEQQQQQSSNELQYTSSERKYAPQER